MDCSKTAVFLVELKRMCANIGGCHKCKIYKLTDPSRLCVDGGGAFAKEPEKCIAIVQEWSDSHPVRTRLSVLKEKLPDIPLYNGEPMMCVKAIYGDVECESENRRKKHLPPVSETCFNCWNTPIEGDESNA